MLRMLGARPRFLRWPSPRLPRPKEREVSIGLQAAITSIDPHYHNLSPNNSAAAARLRAAHHARRRTRSWCRGSRSSWKRDRRPHLGIQAAREREVPRRLAVHRRGRGRRRCKRVPNVPNSPSSFATFVQAHRGHEGRRSATRSSSRPRRRTCCCRATSARCYIVPKLPSPRRRPPTTYNSGKAAIGTGPYKFAEYVPTSASC